MNTSSVFSPEQIHAAAQALQRLRPAYRELLRFYEKIFIAQEASKAHINLEPVQITSELRAIKRREKLPLVDVSDFSFDPQSARDLLLIICDIIQSHNREMTDAAGTIIRGLDQEIEPLVFFSSLLKGDDAYFDMTAAALETDKNALAFVAYSSLKPSVVLCAEQLSGYLKDLVAWEKGYCPICGNFPGLAVLDHDGRRLLHCNFCWTTWPAKRIFCPFCEKTGGENLHTVYSEDEKTCGWTSAMTAENTSRQWTAGQRSASSTPLWNRSLPCTSTSTPGKKGMIVELSWCCPTQVIKIPLIDAFMKAPRP